MNWFKLLSFFAVLILCVQKVYPEPEIKQFFPTTKAYLGRPVYWLIKIRYPPWESYNLRFQPAGDLEFEIADKELSAAGEDVVARYRLKLTPLNLAIAETPTVLIYDDKGQTTVITGKPLTIETISGESLDLMPPGTLGALPGARDSTVWKYVLAGILLISAMAFLIFRRRRLQDPVYRLIRDLRKAQIEVRRSRLPLQVWKLLRSDRIWGFSAEALTPSQLKERVVSDQERTMIADTLKALEGWRYAGDAHGSWDAGSVERALLAAEQILRGGRRKR